MGLSVDERLGTALIVWYGLLALVCLFQISRILYFRHMLRSFQFGFLSICLAWCVLRVAFFADGADMEGWVLMIVWWFPVDLQFAMFSLLVMFYGFLLYQHNWEEKRRYAVGAYVLTNLGVLITTLVYVFTTCGAHECTVDDTLERGHHIYMTVQFFILVAVYGYIAYKLWAQDKMSASTVLTLLAWLIFFSRFLYNLLVAINVKFAITILGEDAVSNPIGVQFWVFCLLFLWEVFPSAAVLLFFRTIPPTDRGCCYPRCRSLRLAQLSGESVGCCGVTLLCIGRCCRSGEEIDAGDMGAPGGPPGVGLAESDGAYGGPGLFEVTGEELGDDSVLTSFQPYRSSYAYTQGPDDSYYLYGQGGEHPVGGHLPHHQQRPGLPVNGLQPGAVIGIGGGMPGGAGTPHGSAGGGGGVEGSMSVHYGGGGGRGSGAPGMASNGLYFGDAVGSEHLRASGAGGQGMIQSAAGPARSAVLDSPLLMHSQQSLHQPAALHYTYDGYSAQY